VYSVFSIEPNKSTHRRTTESTFGTLPIVLADLAVLVVPGFQQSPLSLSHLTASFCKHSITAQQK